jgi:transcriptional regulator with XRE-family HTH domain
MRAIERIRREVFKVKQVAFAVIAGTSQGTVSRWENGESDPSLDQLQKIRDAATEKRLPWNDALFFDVARPIPKRRAA